MLLSLVPYIFYSVKIKNDNFEKGLKPLKKKWMKKIRLFFTRQFIYIVFGHSCLKVSVLLRKPQLVVSNVFQITVVSNKALNTLLSLITFIKTISISHNHRKIQPSENGPFRQTLKYVCWIWQFLLLLNIVISWTNKQHEMGRGPVWPFWGL